MTSQSTTRIKPLNSIPNIIFIFYLLISFVIYHYTKANYYSFYSFIMFIIRYIGFSILPIFFIAIYNLKKGKTIFGLVSAIISVLWILAITLGTYGAYVANQ